MGGAFDDLFHHKCSISATCFSVRVGRDVPRRHHQEEEGGRAVWPRRVEGCGIRPHTLQKDHFTPHRKPGEQRQNHKTFLEILGVREEEGGGC